MADVNEVIEWLGCLTTNQHKCGGCPYNPHPGMDWVYGCMAGQGKIVDDARKLLSREGRQNGMSDFLRFVDNLRQSFPVHVEIYYSKIMDWCIRVTKKGCASDYPGSPHDGNDAIMCNVQDCDMELAFAKAHVALKEWMSDYNGGY